MTVRQWLATVEHSLLSSSLPPRLGEGEVADRWTAFTDDERRSWWIAWSNGRLGQGRSLPTEPWRIALVEAVVVAARVRRRRMWWLLVASVPVVLSVLMGVSLADGTDPGLLFDMAPYAGIAVLALAWDEIATRETLRRCRVRPD